MKKLRTFLVVGMLSLGTTLTSVGTAVVIMGGPIAVLTGCQGLHGDPVVINAEKAIKIGFDLCDAFVVYEHENNANGELGQSFRRAADDVRRQAPTWIRVANTMLDSYQLATQVAKTAPKLEQAAADERVKAAQLALASAMQTLQAGQDEATRQLAAAQRAKVEAIKAESRKGN